MYMSHKIILIEYDVQCVNCLFYSFDSQTGLHLDHLSGTKLVLLPDCC